LEVCRRRAARVHRGRHCSSVRPEALEVACCKTLEAGKDERGERIWSSTARGNEEGHFREKEEYGEVYVRGILQVG
jgi:hypothetical protein